MWRLWHYLFGWDYVIIEFAGDCYIRRVHKGANGVEFVRLYGVTPLKDTWRRVIRLT